MDLKKFEEAQKKYNLSPFKLSTYIQKRARELVHGASPLVPTSGIDIIDVAITELVEGKVVITTPEDEEESEESPLSALPSPKAAPEPRPVLV